jgi:hypothetical protein
MFLLIWYCWFSYLFSHFTFWDNILRCMGYSWCRRRRRWWCILPPSEHHRHLECVRYPEHCHILISTGTGNSGCFSNWAWMLLLHILQLFYSNELLVKTASVRVGFSLFSLMSRIFCRGFCSSGFRTGYTGTNPDEYRYLYSILGIFAYLVPEFPKQHTGMLAWQNSLLPVYQR